MPVNQEFAALVDEGVRAVAARRYLPMKRIVSDLDRKLRKAGFLLADETAEDWRRGLLPAQSEHTAVLVRYLVEKSDGGLSRLWAERLLRLARYPDPHTLLNDLFHSFADWLRYYRSVARMTPAQLAARFQEPESLIPALEGRRPGYYLSPGLVARLADALQLSDADRATLEAAAEYEPRPAFIPLPAVPPADIGPIVTSLAQFLTQHGPDITLGIISGIISNAISTKTPNFIKRLRMPPKRQTHSAEQSHQCKALTKAGARCKKATTAGSTYCWIHQKTH